MAMIPKFSMKNPIMLVAIVLIVLLAIGAALYVYNLIVNKSMRKEFFKDIGGGCSAAQHSLIFFYMDQCPHCVKFKPEWDKCVKVVNGGKYGSKVCVREFSADVRDMSEKYGVDGYPTIVLENLKTGKKIVYDGPRTTDGVLKFVSANT